jgi:hypothetical protein
MHAKTTVQAPNIEDDCIKTIVLASIFVSSIIKIYLNYKQFKSNNIYNNSLFAKTMVLAIKVMPKLLFQHLIVCPNSSFGKTAFKSMPKLLFRHVQNMSTAKFLQYMYIYISKTISFCSFGASSLILGIV